MEIFNLSAEGTVEDYMLEILDRKLNMFELVIGEMDMILGHLEDERDFEEIVLDIWTQARTPEEAAAGFEATRRRAGAGAGRLPAHARVRRRAVRRGLHG